MDWLKITAELYNAGHNLYNMIAQTLEETEDTQVIVSPANLGDTVFIASLAEEYKKTYNIKNLIIVAKERQAQAVKWFNGVDDILGLSDDEIIALRYYFVISKNFYSHKIRYGHVPCEFYLEYPNVFIHEPPGFGGDTLMHVWQERILHISKDCPISSLVVPDGIVPSKDNIEKFKNAILLAPAAFTNKGIPISFWNKLASVLIRNGYDVYNNNGGLSYDILIDGIKTFDATTEDLIINTPLFKHVVSVRSGFTDLVSKVPSSLTVLHLGGNPSGSLRVEYGKRNDDVRDLGRIENIYPIVYCGEREDEIINLILENIEQ